MHLVILKNAIYDRTEYFEPVILDKLYFTCVCMDIKKCSISLVGFLAYNLWNLNITTKLLYIKFILHDYCDNLMIHYEKNAQLKSHCQ